MATTSPPQRRYDHRLREHVRSTRDIDCALQRGVPRSTVRGWLKDPGADPPETTDSGRYEDIVCRKRLGGLLKSYSRKAA